MKKILNALALLLLTLGSASFAQAEKIVVCQIQGNPVIVRNGQEIAVAKGASCQTNDVLKTTSGCAVDIAMNDQAGCRVLASSEVLIASANENRMSLKITSGNVILNVKKLSKEIEFRVETPTAIAAVRGTQFWGNVHYNKGLPDTVGTTFAVREGSVDIFAKSFGKSFTIETGQALDIPMAASKLPVIRSALQNELDTMAQAETIKTSGPA